MKEIALILAVLCGVLAAATATGRVLQARYAGSAAVANLNDRVNAWWAIVFVLAAAAFAGEIAVAGLFGLLSLLALREFLQATGGRHAIVGAMLCGLGIACVPALLTLEQNGREMLLVAFLLLIAQSNDVLQYVWGKLAGRHKLAPTISPGKTVEGFVGGLLCSTALGAMLAWITPFTVWQAAGAALAIALAGVAGGLVLSAIKRECGIKDWGGLVPGHGGVLDRLDSLCLSAPVFYLLVRAATMAA